MWLYIPPTSPSTREAQCSMRDLDKDSLDSVFQSLSQSATWRETLKRERYWSTKYSRDNWFKHLCGLIPTPSTANRLLEKWMQSSEGSPANLGHLPEPEKEARTRDGFGTTLGESLRKYDPLSSSWKTSQDSFLEGDSTKFSKISLRSGTIRNGFLYERPTLARLIEENGYSSWPTPAARDYKDTGPNTNYQKIADKVKLAGAAMMWMTPNTMDALPPKSQKALDKESSTVRKGRKAPNNLRDQVNVQQGQAEWPTPTTQEYPHPDMKINAKGRREPKKGKTDHSLNLQDRSAMWMTPTSRDWKDGDGTANVETNSLLGRQAPRTLMPGQKSSENDPTSHQRRLNPKFVEWLMGWPEDWITFVVLGYSGSSETE